MKIVQRGRKGGSCAVRRVSRVHQRGVSLIISLVMLVAVLILGTSAALLALQSEKASRNERDRQIAFQAAEAALMDAELDIEHSPDAANSRSLLFSKNSAMGFPGDGEGGCTGGYGSTSLGLCKRAEEGASPAWQSVDFTDDQPATARSVPYGRYTGQSFQIDRGSLPGKLPRYVIELMTYNRNGESAEKPTYFYRITAVGFGPRDTTQVMLQTFYRKES